MNHEIKEDRNHAQLLIQISPNSRTYEELKRIIEGLGAHIIQTKCLKLDWILVKLDVTDIREIALKLTENGFPDIKGVNALP